MEFEASSLAEMKPVAQAIIQRLSETPIVLLQGEIGSGKTSLVRLIMQEVDIIEEVSSPTYSIVQRYDGPLRSFFHFDLYRIERQEELLDLGFEEYLESGIPCLIEWPDVAQGLLPERVLKVQIKVINEIREVSLEV